MDIKGREMKLNWICAFFLTTLICVVVSAPTDLQEECIDQCKDIQSQDDKEQCILKHCSDSEIKRAIGGFVRIGKNAESEFEDDIPLEEQDKRASNFVRIGKAARNSFVRIGKANRNAFVRIGKANRNSFVRIGKSYPRYFLRMIKGNPSAFVRIGRGNPGSFVRIGKSADSSQIEEQPEEDKRMSSFVRIGKAGPSSFVRIGKAGPSSFVRIGRRPEDEETDSLNYDGTEPQSMESRQDPSTFLRLG